MVALDNDARGWIMASVSGVACCVGASIICVDLLVQRFPRGRNWRIQDSNTFLSSSLSLSFGVMLYSALYNMLPSAKSNLIEGGLSPGAASYTLTGCFLGGVIGITIVSRFIHHHMPSKVVDCDHQHEEEEGHEDVSPPHHNHSHEGTYDHSDDDEDTPLLSRTELTKPRTASANPALGGEEIRLRPDAPLIVTPQLQSPKGPTRPPLKPSLTKRVTTFMAGGKALCDEGGPCHGYGDPCGQACFKVLTRDPSRIAMQRPSGAYRTLTLTRYARGTDEEHGGMTSSSPRSVRSWNGDAHPDRVPSRRQSSTISAHSHTHSHSHSHSRPHSALNGDGDAKSGHAPADGKAHHHHVPTNAFLAIGLQTSIAIALHKLPEGFITYATNHANPKLGFSVFMALFIHNITEGFAMALPLYLAVGSRSRAMLWSALLGGISQPLGAGIAAVWLSAAQNHDMLPSEGVYGGMFAVTAGIMTSVALQLFSESLGLTHNKNLCVAWAFAGMGILGISNALTA